MVFLFAEREFRIFCGCNKMQAKVAGEKLMSCPCYVCDTISNATL